MITIQRRALILDYLHTHGSGSIVDIAEALGTSQSSVRRDLDHLAALGSITRSHGGATIGNNPLTTFEPPRRIGASTLREEKMAIGAAAAGMVANGNSIILDSSTTVLAMAQSLANDDAKATVCTNDLEIAEVLSARQNTNLIVLGGSLRPGSLTMVGEPLTSFLDHLHVDLAFIGIHSFSGGRLSETSIDVSMTKKKMIESAARVVILIDSSKFEHPAFFEVGGLDDIDVVITDEGITPEVRVMIEDSETELVIVRRAPAVSDKKLKTKRRRTT